MLMKMTKPCLCSISGGTTLRIDCPRHGAYSIVWCKVCKSSVRYESHDSEHFKMSSLIPSPTTMKEMNDLKPFKHGQEGTHYACDYMVNKFGSIVQCCECIGCKHCQPSEEKECKFCKTRNLICKCGINCDVFKSHIWNKKPSEKGTEGWEAKLSNLLTKMSEHYLIDEEFESQLKWFIKQEIQTARREVVEDFVKEVCNEYLYAEEYLPKAKDKFLKKLK